MIPTYKLATLSEEKESSSFAYLSITHGSAPPSSNQAKRQEKFRMKANITQLKRTCDVNTATHKAKSREEGATKYCKFYYLITGLKRVNAE